MSIRENVFDAITGVFKRHGAVSISTPVFELKVHFLVPHFQSFPPPFPVFPSFLFFPSSPFSLPLLLLSSLPLLLTLPFPSFSPFPSPPFLPLPPLSSPSFPQSPLLIQKCSPLNFTGNSGGKIRRRFQAYLRPSRSGWRTPIAPL